MPKKQHKEKIDIIENKDWPHINWKNYGKKCAGREYAR